MLLTTGVPRAGAEPGLGNPRTRQPRAPPTSPAPPRSSNLGAQAAQRGDGGDAGQAEAAPGSALLHRGLAERKKGAVCASLQLTRLGTETGSGARRSEEAEENAPVVWGLGGWGRPWPGTAYQERCQERWAALAAPGRGAAVWRPRQRIGAPLFSPPPSTLARNLTLSVLREPPFLASSRLPQATCLQPSHTHPQAIPAKPWDPRNAHSGSPSQASQGTYQLWGPRDGGNEVLEHPAAVSWVLPLRPVCLLTCSLIQFLVCVSSGHSFPFFFFFLERLCLWPHLVSVSNLSLPVSLSGSLSPLPARFPPHPPQHFLFQSFCFCSRSFFL